LILTIIVEEYNKTTGNEINAKSFESGSLEKTFFVKVLPSGYDAAPVLLQRNLHLSDV
jgi:hypothetical protein